MSSVNEESIHIHLPQFDGPLALLLHLVKEEEIPIRELDINKITAQYISYLNQMKNLNFDIAGEYLYMAATLLHLKSTHSVQEEEVAKLLKDMHSDDAIQSTADLVRQLEELERFQTLSKILWEQSEVRGRDTFARAKTNKRLLFDSLLAPSDAQKLTSTMMDVLYRESRKYQVVKRDRLSIKEKLLNLQQILQFGETFLFKDLVNWEKGLDDIVITFISLLELARLKKIEVTQENEQGSIEVSVIAPLGDLNVEEANGFEPEGELN